MFAVFYLGSNCSKPNPPKVSNPADSNFFGGVLFFLCSISSDCWDAWILVLSSFLSSFFDSLSINSYFIELGGEIRYKGNKQKNIPWLAAIESPDQTNSPIMTLSSKDYKNLSLATSGEYRNFIELNGNTFSHTIDPQTFKPINREHISVSVIAENAMKADALATALNVMGLEEGLDFSNKNKIKALYVVKENEEFILKTSKWF